MVAPLTLEQENHARDAEYMKALHGKSTDSRGGLMAMMSKGADAKAASVENYFKHWDNKAAAEETPETRAERRALYASLTREYYVSPLPLTFSSQAVGTDCH